MLETVMPDPEPPPTTIPTEPGMVGDMKDPDTEPVMFHHSSKNLAPAEAV